MKNSFLHHGILLQMALHTLNPRIKLCEHYCVEIECPNPLKLFAAHRFFFQYFI